MKNKECSNKHYFRVTRTHHREKMKKNQAPHSSVREHSMSCPATIDIHSLKILFTASSETDLRILESYMYFSTKSGY